MPGLARSRACAGHRRREHALLIKFVAKYVRDRNGSNIGPFSKLATSTRFRTPLLNVKSNEYGPISFAAALRRIIGTSSIERINRI